MSISNRKVVIVGAGHVGSHVGYALISQSLADEIVYIDSDRAKAVAQALDLTDATNYLPVRTKVTAGDYSDAADAQIMIIAAGPLPSGSQTRMDTLGQTIEILKEVTASIKKSGFDGIIVNISNPADVITHYIQHTLNWAPERIFSTSTTLDSARLRRAIAQETGIDQKSITAYALGEHGESQMVAWSAVTIAGKPLSQWRDEYPDTFGKLDLDALADAGRERLLSDLLVLVGHTVLPAPELELQPVPEPQFPGPLLHQMIPLVLVRRQAPEGKPEGQPGKELLLGVGLVQPPQEIVLVRRAELLCLPPVPHCFLHFVHGNTSFFCITQRCFITQSVTPFGCVVNEYVPAIFRAKNAKKEGEKQYRASSFLIFCPGTPESPPYRTPHLVYSSCRTKQKRPGGGPQEQEGTP